ncbi:uncharacterized protein LOC131245189 [Magnolia sinica]|uniref:uncharacterized protein LOC131245189 n=1 Tax=Magnolia sinica TaxID=86752 RepID=UPI002658AB47|nr:uncharacterized protein LOC131245189 [Magnolia sinica]
MHPFNPPTLGKTHSFCGFSAFRPSPHSSNRFVKKPSWDNTNRLNFILKIPSWTPPAIPSGRKELCISAHFSRVSKRRNSLRRKLVEEGKVRSNPNSYILDPNSNNPNYVPAENKKPQLASPYVNEEDSVYIGSEGDDIESVTVEKSNIFGESVLWSRLENWVDQYKKDNEYWGTGSGPVFTVFEDSDGNVSRVSVNEDEIIRRHELGGDAVDVNSKIARAKLIAREVEIREYEFPKNSSIAKFVVEGDRSFTINRDWSATLRGDLFPRLSRIGFAMVCGCFVFWTLKKMFMARNDGVELTSLEKEMLRRKMRSRMEKGKMEGSNVEVLPSDLVFKSQVGPIERPQLDKHELMKSILGAKASSENLAIPDSSGSITANDWGFDDKILEIQEMARRARELERQDPSQHDSDRDDGSVSDILQAVKVKTSVDESNADEKADAAVEGLNSDGVSESQSHLDVRGNEDLVVEIEDGKMDGEKGADFLKILSKPLSADYRKTDGTECFNEILADAEYSDSLSNTRTSSEEVTKDELKVIRDPNEREIGTLHTLDTGEETESRKAPNHKSSSSSKISVQMKPRIIRSVEEARNYLSQTRGSLTDEGKPLHESRIKSLPIGPHVCSPSNEEELNGKAIQAIEKTQISESSNDEEPSTKGSCAINGKNQISEYANLDEMSDPTFVKNASEDFTLDKEGLESDTLHSLPNSTAFSESLKPSATLNAASLRKDGTDKRHEVNYLSTSRTSSQDSTAVDNLADAKSLKVEQSWIEKNFQEFEPIAKKIGVGFQENFMAAKENVQDLSNSSADITQLGFKEDDDELGWMKDDDLREIVFQVRENELAGRDPFHLMDAEDQSAFFKGLERKVEIENEKLLGLHELVHSRVENLDYGADGISLDDPPEKIIPRWKGPPPDKDPEFLNNFVGQQKVSFAENLGMSHPANRDIQDGLQESKEPSSDATSPSSGVGNLRKISESGASTNPKTVIEGSDGSTRAGKKSGKEHWQHTKKWSREFQEVYNAETDPEIKSVMKDMGKDLDRWITDKEIQEAADLMTRIPKRRRRYIEKKLDKLKREMEMFGPQAVVSKYREYSEEKEEDYLWWLDLPFVLCIELYTNEDNVQRVGFYSLEMAVDLELEPKQHHVIAFEDPGDCKNLCYIIQAHMDMLGNGRAFVVAQPPKDAFREAKANGFNVTVIRKGELQLNVDQTLEEVEAEITEIGSKMYHDKIMQERSVDMGALMKGVFSAGKTTKRRPGRMLARPPKS